MQPIPRLIRVVLFQQDLYPELKLKKINIIPGPDGLPASYLEKVSYLFMVKNQWPTRTD